MNDLFGHRTTLGQVRVRLPQNADGDSHRWRWLAQDALNQVQIAPVGLPPQAILIVRHVPDPQPGVLLDADRGVQRWGASAQAHLGDCWRRAARPAYEPVSGTVDAVWFADTAEWLACLSWDIVNGAAYGRWWWQTWLRQTLSGDVSAMLHHLWSEAIAAVPQAVTLLHQQQGISALVAFNQMQAQHVIALRAALLTEYDLERYLAHDQITATLTPLLNPSQRSLVTMLPAQQAAFVALALVITTNPTALHRIQHDGFAAMADRPTSPPVHDDDLPATQAEPDAPSTPSQHMTDADNDHTPVPTTARPDKRTATINDDDAQAAREEPAFGDDFTETARRVTDDNVTGDSGAAPAAALPQTPAAATDDDKNRPPSIDDHDLLAEREALLFSAQGGIRTEIGGVWYLVNVLAELDWLYHHDFAALNAYHKISMLARHWIGDAYDDDPLWPILAELAHDELSLTQAAAWLDEALPVMRDWLAQRLDDPHDFLDALTEGATLYVTRTHVDVVFSLEQIRLDLRLAGLDRNPGWVPQLARIITLHYE